MQGRRLFSSFEILVSDLSLKTKLRILREEFCMRV